MIDCAWLSALAPHVGDSLAKLRRRSDFRVHSQKAAFPEPQLALDRSGCDRIT
jgi:hypothetical protein